MREGAYKRYFWANRVVYPQMYIKVVLILKDIVILNIFDISNKTVSLQTDKHSWVRRWCVARPGRASRNRWSWERGTAPVWCKDPGWFRCWRATCQPVQNPNGRWMSIHVILRSIQSQPRILTLDFITYSRRKFWRWEKKRSIHQCSCRWTRSTCTWWAKRCLSSCW